MGWGRRRGRRSEGRVRRSLLEEILRAGRLPRRLRRCLRSSRFLASRSLRARPLELSAQNKSRTANPLV